MHRGPVTLSQELGFCRMGCWGALPCWEITSLSHPFWLGPCSALGETIPLYTEAPGSFLPWGLGSWLPAQPGNAEGGIAGFWGALCAGQVVCWDPCTAMAVSVPIQEGLSPALLCPIPFPSGCWVVLTHWPRWLFSLEVTDWLHVHGEPHVGLDGAGLRPADPFWYQISE